MEKFVLNTNKARLARMIKWLKDWLIKKGLIAGVSSDWEHITIK